MDISRHSVFIRYLLVIYAVCNHTVITQLLLTVYRASASDAEPATQGEGCRLHSLSLRGESIPPSLDTARRNHWFVI